MNMLNKNKIRTDSGGHGEARGSVTVETAFAFPIFFFCIWMFWQLFLVILLEMNVTLNVYRTAREFSAVEYINRTAFGKEKKDEKFLLLPVLYANLLAGTNGINDIMIADCSMSGDDDYIIEVTVDHPVAAPFFKAFHVTFKHSYRIRGNTGVWDDNKLTAKNGKDTSKPQEPEKNEKVYVTENGTVFHRDPGCCYLSVKAEAVKADDVKNRRNRDGKKYTECVYCRNSPHTDEVYITLYGTKFHYCGDCGQLKRSVREVDLSEVGKMTPCSKCGGKNEQ